MGRRGVRLNRRTFGQWRAGRSRRGSEMLWTPFEMQLYTLVYFEILV